MCGNERPGGGPALSERFRLCRLGAFKCQPQAGKCEESPADASVFSANSHGNAPWKWMNNVCSERISLTYQMFAFIHLFTRVAAEHQAELGFPPSVFFIYGLIMSGFSAPARLMKLTRHVKESLNQSRAETHPIPQTESGAGTAAAGSAR